MRYATDRLPSWRRLGIAATVFCALATQAAPALGRTSPAGPPPVLTLEEAARLLRVDAVELERLALRNRVPARRIGARWRFNRAALLAWLNGDWALITAAVPPAPSLGPRELDRARGTGPGIAQAAPPPRDSGESAPIGEAPEERTAEDVFLRSQKVLLGAGEVSVDVGQFYSRSDSRQLASVGAGIGLATVEREAFTTLLLGRVGVQDETELFAGTTFRDEDSALYLGSNKLSDSGRTEFGDVRLGVRRTLLREGPGRPDVIATLEGRIPTGDTSYAVGGGLALVKSIDPVVLFGNANYRHTFSRDFPDVTRLEPEDQFDVTLGYALALNDTLTLSSSVSGLFSGATRFDTTELRQQDSFSLQFALTSWLAEGLYIEPSVSFGLNGPGNAMVFGVTVPYTFPR